MEWPDGFMWGTGASSTQCEGAAPASDWWDWERAGKAPLSGEGNGFATRYAEDFTLLAGLGLTHHRLSIEWARVEPEPGVHDPAAVEHYRAVLTAAHDAGITPWVTLHHFTLPRWFAADGGFTVEANRTGAWARHVDWVAETFGDLAGGWQPVNETNLYGLLHYGGFGLPPDHHDLDEAAAVDEQIQLATAEAAVRLRQTGAPVASIFGLAAHVAQDDDPATTSFVEFIDDGLWHPGLRLFRDGVLRSRGRAPIERPDLAGAFDLIGFSYYMALGVKDGSLATHPPGARLSPLGYGIFPDGLGLVLDRLHADLPGTPLLVAEYGIGTADDAERAAYVTRGLEVVQERLAAGVDVRGFFHWTAVDNYEWLHGFDADAAFGLITADRTVKPSAEVLAREARPERRSGGSPRRSDVHEGPRCQSGTMTIGPVEYVVIEFPGNRFHGDIAPALGDIIDSGVVRIIDLVFVKKSADGKVQVFEYDELDEASSIARLDGEAGGLIGEEDVADVAEVLHPDSSALLVVWEDRWAAPLAAAVRAAGGEIVAGSRIHHEIVAETFAEIPSAP